MGYKDGMHDGQESQFQESFDAGYEQGFKNGFLLGKYKGSPSTTEEQNDCSLQKNANSSNDLILSRSSRGHCVVCTDKSLQESSIGEIIAKQTSQMDKIENVLQSRYGIK